MEKTMPMKLIISSIFVATAFTLSAQTSNSPTMGWSSWNTYRVNISDSLIRHQADCMVATGLSSAGYTYINIDDGFQGGRTAEGVLKINRHRFPNGLKPVVSYIHSLGLHAGIYSDAGRNTCGNYYDHDTLAVGVGLYGHDIDDARLYFRDLGFDFIKIDFCGGDAKQNTDRLQLDEQTRYTAIRQAIDSVAGHDVRMNVCRWNYPGTWVGRVADSWRTTSDISDDWKSVRSIIHDNLFLSAYSSEGHYNDMDMLEVGRSLTDEEDRTHFGLWCIMESPLLIGCDLGSIRPATLRLLCNPELIALSQQYPHQQAYPVALSDGVHILVKDVEEPYGRHRAVAFYNPADEAAKATLKLSDVDLEGPVTVRNVMERKDEASINTNAMTVEVPAHGCRIYVLSGQGRLDRERYEAECAYISDYQELWNNQARGTGIYEYDDHCSAGMKATWLGGKADNDLQWRSVYVHRGKRAKLVFKCESEGSFAVSVNGKDVATISAPSAGIYSIKATLLKGSNTVRLHNDSGRMPDIDYMLVER